MVGDGQFDQTLIEGAVFAIFNFVLATGLYFRSK